MPKRKYKLTAGERASSLVIGIISSGLIGWSLGSTIARYSPVGKTTIIVTTTALFMVGGALLSWFFPAMTELLSFGFATYVALQAYWDLTHNDWSWSRFIMGVGAVLLFAFNFFTGKLRKGTAKKVIRAHLGVR